MVTANSMPQKEGSSGSPQILLPPVIRILRNKANQSIQTDHSEYNLYFSNFIMPYRPEWDIQVRCEYGANYGDRWSICDRFPRDRDTFPLGIVIYDDGGKKLAEKTVTIRLCDRSVEMPPYRVLFFGDSMTHDGSYITHIATRLYALQSVGSRTFNGWIYVEGRGGWDLDSYFTHRLAVPGRVPSPFMFPEGIDGDAYYGDMLYWDEVKNPDHNTYAYDGYRYEALKEGQYFLSEGKLYQQTGEKATLVDEDPPFAFSFSKYMARHGIPGVDAVSVLIGCNDLQLASYEETDEKLTCYMAYLRALIASIHAYDPHTAVILNFPVLGGEQYAWGARLGCRTTEKTYRYNMQRIVLALLEEYAEREAERIYLCPMQAVVDPVYGFKRGMYPVNLYTAAFREAAADWVHPCREGYCQMGDALAAVIEDIRQSEKIDKE